ncbi:MAG: ABC transporter permease [Eubacterium sp.]|nr:ABC transporter permease [Eubacterium sp.]
MKTISRIAWSNNKKNKTRSILIMAAVFLTTVLLTVICTYAFWIYRTEKANADTKYGSYYGTFLNVGKSQLREIRRHGEFSKIGLVAQAGSIRMDGSYSFLALDEDARELLHMDRQFAEGRFPQEERELAAQEEFFEKIGYKDIHIGDTVTLDYRRDMKHPYGAFTFKVSGILKPQEEEAEQNVFMLYVSQAFVEAQEQNEEAADIVVFRLADEVPVTVSDAQDVIVELARRCGIEEKNVAVNSLYLMYTLNLGAEIMAFVGVLVAAVILFSVMIVYHIFQVGIVQNIREYGKIRALGATKKQMRSLIYQEGLFLAVCSIPAGAVAGEAVSCGCIQWLIANGGVMVETKVGIFSPAMLLLAVGLALLTVLLALRRPMKIAGAISPVDALRYMESTGKRQAGFRKGRASMNVRALAAANIAANKKRTAMTIVTMGLSCVLFVVLANCVGNMDVDFEARRNVEYGQFQIELIYDQEDEAYSENNLDAILKENPLNHALIQKILEIEGVTGIKTRNILSAELSGEKIDIAVFDEESFEQAKQQGVSGDVDFREGEEEPYFYYGYSYALEQEGYRLRQPLTAEVCNGAETATVNATLAGAFLLAPADFVITEAMYEKMGLSGASLGWLWVDCAQEDAEAVQAELERLLDGTEHVMMTAYAQEWHTAQLAVRWIKSACYLFLVVLGLIGFMNLANTMILNVITKKQEYGILQAVGMTNRQLNASMQLQGLLFSAGTVLVAVFAGLPLGYVLFCYAKKNAVYGINAYHVPAKEIVCMALVIAALQAVLSYLLSRNLKKESLVERIRYQE